MRRLSGQAARHAGRLLHWLATLAVALGVLGGVAVGALAWRLSQGPLELPWLTQRVEAAFNQDRTTGHIAIGAVGLAWEGFRLGLGRSLEIRLDDVSFADAAGKAILNVPRVEITLSLHEAVFGRLVLRTMEIDGPHITLVRAADGSILSEPAKSGTATPPAETLPETPTDARSLLALLSELAQPAATDNSATRTGPFSQLRLLQIHDAALIVLDRKLGTTWQAPHAEIELTRGAAGGVSGIANLSLLLGDQQARLTATATLPPGHGPIRLRLRLSPVTPAAIARAVASAAKLGAAQLGAAKLAALDAPIGGEADLRLDAAMRLIDAHVALQAGAGAIHVADGVLPITSAAAAADVTADHATLNSLRVTVPSHLGGAPTVLDATGWVDRGGDHMNASLSVDLDRVDFADLPHVWPVGLGRGARGWITENITAGTAHNGHFEVGVSATSDLAAVTVTRATGTLAGDGLVASWLRPVPPIENGVAVLNILDPDTLEIVVRSGHQLASISTGGTQGLTLTGGRMRITGVMQRDQFGTIDAQIAGAVPDAIALLKEKRLGLLDKHPLALNDPTGQMTGTLSLSLPLETRTTMDDVTIRAHAHLDAVHLSGVVAGRNLDQGVLDLDANVDGLSITGTGALAGIPTNLKASMDFRAGGPADVVQRISATGRPTAQQLVAAGLDVSAVVDGTLGLNATLTERRDGGGEIGVTADLAPATVAIGPLGWRKPPGTAMTASGRIALSHDRLIGIDTLQVSGGGAAVTGSVTCVGGKPSVVRIERLVLGRTEAQATIRLPMEAAAPIAISANGPTLDLAARLTRPSTPSPQRRPHPPPSGPHWTLEANFDRVIMAGDHQITALAVRLDSDGGLTRQLAVDGATGGPSGPNAPFSVRIVPGDGKRRLRARATNAGDLLAGLDVIGRMQGGQLVLTGAYDDTTVEHALEGTAEINDFRIRDAPILARLLQAMTLYGLTEILRGPGLGFTQLTAPFRLTDDTLTLTNARAFSSSLGLTAKGTIDRDREVVALEGTIVPAYFFNSLLGNIPLVGRLFSPEQGGGVFAASYSVRGPLDDPDVAVNPLSALTPGFLRGLFGLF